MVEQSATPHAPPPPGAAAPPDRGLVERADLSETTRLETFADGVLAIAITLLVLEIQVPAHDVVVRAGGLGRALAWLWPSYVGYAISFATIGIMWVNHHAMFHYIRRADRVFLLLNVFFLFCVAFLPFPTAVLADYLPDPEERRAAAVFYGAWLVVVALAFNAVWRYGVRGGRLLGAGVDRRGVDTISRRYRFGPVSYAAATALALVSVPLSLAVHAALAVLFALPELSSRDGASAAAP
ncbi:MAG TPA: TMEM175 family protein [Gemmatimonadaceae bacterium]|nr:TMEM175 family protein [Gemmatimonadaceae bacterium]